MAYNQQPRIVNIVYQPQKYLRFPELGQGSEHHGADGEDGRQHGGQVEEAGRHRGLGVLEQPPDQRLGGRIW